MNTVNQIIAAAVAVCALASSAAYAEVKPSEDLSEEFVVSIDAVVLNIPDDIDKEILLRICSNNPNKSVCRGEVIQ